MIVLLQQQGMNKDVLRVWIFSLFCFMRLTQADMLNARYHVVPGEIGGLCSGWTPDRCHRQIRHVLVHSVVECAIRCTKHPRCKSYNYQLRPNSPRHTHRCEMAPDKSYSIRTDVKKSSGYQYYKNVT